MAARFGKTRHRTSNASPGGPEPETFSHARPHAVANLRGFATIPLEIRFSTVLPKPYVLSMFISVADDTQAPRDTSGRLGSADDTARFEGTATDGAQGPEAGAVEAAAP